MMISIKNMQKNTIILFMLLFKFLSEENYVFMTFGNCIDFWLFFELMYIYSGYKCYGMGQSTS